MSDDKKAAECVKAFKPLADAAAKMKAKPDDGGPAFPTGEVLDRNGQIQDYMVGGMTLRDYFAAKAMSGLIHIGAMPDASPRVVAEYAYKFADGMLKARNQ